MTKRITTWLASLAILAGLRKLLMSAGKAVNRNMPAFRSQPRRFASARRFASRRFASARRIAFAQQRRGFTFPWQRRRASRMSPFPPLLLGLGLGAGFMYVFNTEMSGDRRSALTDQATRAAHDAEGALADASRDARNRAAKMQGMPGDGNGYDQPQRNWSPAMRVLGGLAGASLAASTFSAGGLPRVAGGVVGLGLLARSFTNVPVKRLMSMRGSQARREASWSDQGAQQRFMQRGGRGGERDVALEREPVGRIAWEGREATSGAARGGEIARSQWEDFCETFSQQHAGWRVTLETDELGGSHRTVAEDLPLMELSSETRGGGFALRVVMGKNITETLAHNIENVQSMRLQTNDAGAHEGLQVRAAAGTTTLRFSTPATPDQMA